MVRTRLTCRTNDGGRARRVAGYISPDVKNPTDLFQARLRGRTSRYYTVRRGYHGDCLGEIEVDTISVVERYKDNKGAK